MPPKSNWELLQEQMQREMSGLAPISNSTQMSPEEQVLMAQSIARRPAAVAPPVPQGTEVVPPPPESTPQPSPQEKAMEALRARLMKEQMGDIALQEKYRGNLEGAPVQLDLTPLMALTDAWSGSKLAQSYKKPRSLDELTKSQSGLTELARRGRQSLLGNLAESSLRDQTRQEALDYRKKHDKNQFGVKLVGKMESDPVVKKATSAAADADRVRALVYSDSPIAHKSIPTVMARAMGEVGALTEADKAPFGGSSAFAEQLSQYKQNALTGKLTDNNKAFVLKLIDVMEDSAIKRGAKRRKQLHTQYTKAQKIFSSDELKEIMGIVDEPEKPTAAPSALDVGGKEIIERGGRRFQRNPKTGGYKEIK